MTSWHLCSGPTRRLTKDAATRSERSRFSVLTWSDWWHKQEKNKKLVNLWLLHIYIHITPGNFFQTGHHEMTCFSANMSTRFLFFGSEVTKPPLKKSPLIISPLFQIPTFQMFHRWHLCGSVHCVASLNPVRCFVAVLWQRFWSRDLRCRQIVKIFNCLFSYTESLY